MSLENNIKIPAEYTDLYGDCAPNMYRNDKIKNKIESARLINPILGYITDKYYRIFMSYRSEEDSMKIAFDSIRDSLEKNGWGDKLKKGKK